MSATATTLKTTVALA